MEQLSLLKPSETAKWEVDKGTTVKLGKHSARIYTKKKNREAIEKLREILSQLKGKDILVSQFCDFWWYDNLRLSRLQLQWFGNSAVVLWGAKGANVRILELRFLYQVREQYLDNGKPYHLLDFWNGFRAEPVYQYSRGGHQCLEIRPAR
jgi:hypothetical protein